MSVAVIQAEGLSKEYNRARAASSGLLRDTLAKALRSPMSLFRRESQEKFWALDDVSLQVKVGEVVALIGRNGSGKTTLLKILSRITQPTKGWGEIHGRVGSLLEVGTGFHPELTGRENTYLSGAILGMSKQEITRKFDEIVSFAELEKFIDTPVKHYSSGMYVRLAFAVAAHLEPEILLVDEVLAVGDANFQEKCMGKMSDVSRQGRTILFVSHNMGAVAQLCSRALILDHGRVIGDSDAQSAIAQYLQTVGRSGNTAELSADYNPKAAAVVTKVWLEDEQGDPISSVDVRRPFQVGMEFLARTTLRGMDVAFRIENSLQQPIFTSCMFDRIPDAEFSPGTHTMRAKVPGHFLAPDTYFITPILHRPNVEIVDIHDRVLTFRVEESGSNMWQYAGSRYGCVLVSLDWDRKEGSN